MRQTAQHEAGHRENENIFIYIYIYQQGCRISGTTTLLHLLFQSDSGARFQGEGLGVRPS